MVEKLTYLGMDSHERPVYQSESGILWKDTDPRRHVPPSLYTALHNTFEGEPDLPWPLQARFKLIPKRKTW